MKTKEFKIEIKASAEKTWYALWDDAHYRRWTSAFTEGSYAVTDNWKHGSNVHFLAPDGRGMYSIVSENIPNEKMEFTHIGEIKNFEEIELTDETRKWSGAKERYDLSEKDGVTTLIVTLDINETFGDYFDKTFPLALANVKELAENLSIIVEATVNAPLEQVWNQWINPVDIIAWNNASDDWHTPQAANDFRQGGQFSYRMEAKDGSFGFDFAGVYSTILRHEVIEYTIADGRKVKICFRQEGDQTVITEHFEPEHMNSYDLQRTGWQAILNNFKKHAEK